MDDAAHVRISPPGRFAWLLSFTRGQSAGGLALMVAPVAALAWSDSPGSARCFHPWNCRSVSLHLPLDRCVNDGPMTLFFLTVGLEIRRK